MRKASTPPPPSPEEGLPAAEAAGTGFEETSGRQVLAGSAWNVASLLGPQIWTVIVSVAAARFLGPGLLGRQSYIAFVELSLMTLATGALPLGVMRWIGELRGRGRVDAVPALLRWAWRVEGVAAAGGAGVVLLVGVADGNHVSAWALAAVAAALGVLHAVPAAVLRGIGRWRAASVVSMTTGGVGAAATVAVLAAGGGIAGMFAVEVVVSAVNLLWTAALVRRDRAAMADDGGVGLAEIRPRLLRYVGGLSVDVILTLIVFRRSEFFFLDRYGSDEEIAFYSVAFAAVAAVLRVFDGIAGVLAPAFAELVGADSSSRLRTGFGRAFRLLATGGLVAMAGLLGVGPRLLEVAYGQDFRTAGPEFLVLVALLPFAAVAGVTHALLVGLGRFRIVLAAGAVAAAVNLTLDVLLVPDHAGIGAAVANNAAQLVAGLPVLVVALRAVGGVAWPGRAMGLVVLTALATGATAAAATTAVDGAAGAVLGLSLGGAAGLVGLSAALRRQPEDADWLASVLPGRFGTIAGRVLAREAP